MKIEKKRLINKVLAVVWKLFKRKTSIVIYAPAKHHSIHVLPILELTNRKQYVLYLVGSFQEASRNKVYSNIEELPLSANYDFLVSTEQTQFPSWLNCKTVFLGHGVGPKLNYQKNIELFDFSFSPCTPFFNLHTKTGVETKKIGLPILDKYINQSKGHKVNKVDKQLLVYAPSWSSDISLISDVENISMILSKLDGIELIICPHPNLLVPKLCSGKVFFSKSSNYVNLTERTTLEICSDAQYIVSDISSILYEAIALQKKVYFDGNNEIYEENGAINELNVLSKTIPTLNFNEPIEAQLHSQYPETTDFISDYYFNLGTASNAFWREIKALENS